MKFKSHHIVLFMIMTVLSALSVSFTSSAENWLYKDGKWYYYYMYDEPVENQWITDSGNEYYIGSGGLMTTDKWQTDNEDGKKYYLGADGTKKRNEYTVSGDKFVGPDGTELVSFGKWREGAKKSLKKIISDLNKKNTVTSEQKQYLTYLNASNAAFALYDLNCDEYRDIIVINKDSDNRQVLDIQIWNPEKQEYYAVMESDFTSDEVAVLKREVNLGDVWLVISKDINEFDFQQLKAGEYFFQGVEHYDFGYNEYGDVVYYIDGIEYSANEWNSSLMYRRSNLGTEIMATYYDLNETTIDEQVDRFPTEDEINLFYEKDNE
ncbi:hypothetical protein BXO88_08855 [Oribacterium sp. C9]|uniref:hypothetical protein n=1 Tax=Oribacterium sp. C9 TaxID=1943579 RepID=UPI00098F04C2|nr:hypothetical protein [Oribacterium sp. C9]OON86148.1 hypothetical protein BXO88_08855 [Oribacterium sp. C9]